MHHIKTCYHLLFPLHPSELSTLQIYCEGQITNISLHVAAYRFMQLREIINFQHKKFMIFPFSEKQIETQKARKSGENKRSLTLLFLNLVSVTSLFHDPCMKRTEMTDQYLDLFLSSSTGAFLILPHHPALWIQGSSSFFCALDLWLVCLSVIMIQIIYKNIRQLMVTAFPSEDMGELLSAPPCCWELPSICTLHPPVSGWSAAPFSESTVPIIHIANQPQQLRLRRRQCKKGSQNLNPGPVTAEFRPPRFNKNLLYK